MKPEIKKGFSRFLSAHPQRLHFAAHSHHYWPDVTFDAQEKAWRDSALYADQKWTRIFSEIIPSVQQHIARTLRLPDLRSICFSPNTHDFIVRLLSCFPADRKIRILTTDAEFHSFRRQIDRLDEDQLVEITRIPSEPFDTFAARFCAAAQQGEYDLIFFSHVFFNSGFVTPLRDIISNLPQNIMTVVDGYHGFMAVPTDLSEVAGRVFYLAGGYKYAMAGEGVCFMHCPPSFGLRPRITGWFAEMDTLAEQKSGQVDYATDGARFYGATFDPIGLYRLQAVFEWLQEMQITVDDIHRHTHHLQKIFIEHLDHPDLKNLVIGIDNPARGSFLAFDTPKAALLQKQMEESAVITDHRANRLRFGFGIYHDDADIFKLLEKLK